MLANRMVPSLGWCCVFAIYSASIQKLQFSDKTINFRIALIIICVQKQSQISKAACKVAAYICSSNTPGPPNFDCKRPHLHSAALLVFARFLNNWSRYWCLNIDVSNNNWRVENQRGLTPNWMWEIVRKAQKWTKNQTPYSTKSDSLKFSKMWILCCSWNAFWTYFQGG